MSSALVQEKYVIVIAILLFGDLQKSTFMKSTVKENVWVERKV